MVLSIVLNRFFSEKKMDKSEKMDQGELKAARDRDLAEAGPSSAKTSPPASEAKINENGGAGKGASARKSGPMDMFLGKGRLSSKKPKGRVSASKEVKDEDVVTLD